METTFRANDECYWNYEGTRYRMNVVSAIIGNVTGAIVCEFLDGDGYKGWTRNMDRDSLHIYRGYIHKGLDRYAYVKPSNLTLIKPRDNNNEHKECLADCISAAISFIHNSSKLIDKEYELPF